MKAKKEAFVGIHEQIGGFEIQNEREKLITDPLEPLEEIYLSDKIDSEAVFEYKNPRLTKEELEKELEKVGEYYKPFLSDIAPELETKRTFRNLKTFDWRVGTDEDAADFSRVLSGQGEWEKVTIPHFGEPLGYAVTYYRCDFELTEEEMAQESLWISFKAVDYKAHVYINGVLLGSHTGFFAPFEFDFTKQAKKGKNILVVQVENDFIPMGSNNEYRGTKYTGDKIYAQTGVGYDEPLMGWHHCPAGMGIWQDIAIEGRNHIFIHDIFVRPTAPEKAEVWVELVSNRVALEDVTLDISIYGQNFRETVLEHMLYTPHMDHDDPNIPTTMLKIERGINCLKIPVDIPDAKLWEPETPWLYQVQVSLCNDKEEVIDTKKCQFGMRFFTMDTNCSPKGEYLLNGKKIRCRGVNSQGREQRLVFLKDFDRLLKDYLLAKVGNINYLRITQRPVQDEVYELCDRLGLLVQTDFPAFGCMRRNTITEALRQAQEMEHLIRKHPSCVVSTYINEPWPSYMIQPHRMLTRDEMEVFFSCADKMMHILNPDRVIKPIDGDYDPPVSYGLPDYHCYTCWYNGHGIELGKLHKGFWLPVKENWNYGCGEFGMEGMDTVEVMKKYYPKEWLPENDSDEWTPSTIPGDPPPQVGHLHHMFFETPKTMSEWAEASREYQALAMYFMARAYRRNKKMISYAYHLFVDAYPNGWMKAMVDVDGVPKPAFWEFRSASAPVMVDLRYDRFKAFAGETVKAELRVCNDKPEEIKGEIHYQAYLGDKLILADKKAVTIPASTNTFIGFVPVQIPEIEERTALRIEASLVSESGETLSQHQLPMEAFPNERKSLGKVSFIGEDKKFAEDLKSEFDVNIVASENADESTTVLVFDLGLFKENEKKWLTFSENGAKIILFNLPQGTNKLIGAEIEVKKLPRRPVHFVTRVKEHPMVSDFEANDIRYWYDEEQDFITPILHDTFEAEGFSAIALGANTTTARTLSTPQGTWVKRFAIAEKKMGEGAVLISQIDFRNRIRTNPVAKKLLERLIGDEVK